MSKIARVVLVCLAFVAAVAGVSRAAGEKASKTMIERGKYLVNVVGCQDCHSPKVFTAEGPVPDETKFMSGHPAGSKLLDIDKRVYAPGFWYLMSADLTAFAGPWGVSYAINLTPDDQTGIGLWTEEVFIAAIRTGKHMGNGRPVLPPMPWMYYRNMSDDDLKAVFAYLKSLPAIKNVVPAPTPPPGAAN